MKKPVNLENAANRAELGLTYASNLRSSTGQPTHVAKIWFWVHDHGLLYAAST